MNIFEGPLSVSDGRRLLMLQGPHGPFFADLADRLIGTGADVVRVGFNRGDQAFWRDRARFVPYRGTLADWPAAFGDLVRTHDITDIVLYGDARPVHASAIAAAKRLGLGVHIFEEGYLRPYWISYERGGANGNSRLMALTLQDMERALTSRRPEPACPPARWGELRQHVFYGALYHLMVMWANRSYPNFTPHRSLSVRQEFGLSLRRLMRLPLDAIQRRIVQRRVRQGDFPYHVGLLQLDHDSSFRHHSPFGSTAAFIDLCARAFAHSAPAHHHLVFKAHPLDDDRIPCAKVVAAAAKRHGLQGRVHYIRAGKLGELLDNARSAVTVNSTSAQQVLWRGLPLKAVGRAVYCKAGLVSAQPLVDFFNAPDAPDISACRTFRQFLLQTSQVPGGYYSARGRKLALRRVVDMMLAPADPYDTLCPPQTTHDVVDMGPKPAGRATAQGRSAVGRGRLRLIR